VWPNCEFTLQSTVLFLARQTCDRIAGWLEDCEFTLQLFRLSREYTTDFPNCNGRDGPTFCWPLKSQDINVSPVVGIHSRNRSRCTSDQLHWVLLCLVVASRVDSPVLVRALRLSKIASDATRHRLFSASFCSVPFLGSLFGSSRTSC
jgi:hypothetical protein